MTWTTAADLRAQTLRLWDKGSLLAALVDPAPLFPHQLKLKTPSSSELSERFDEVRRWSRDLADAAKTPDGRGFRLTTRQVRHHVIGSNTVATQAWLDSVDDALALIDRQREGRRFVRLLEATRAAQPSLTAWLQAHPLRALALEADWSHLLAVAAWVRDHPRPNIYLRQVDIAGVHSKFIEAHRGVLSEWLDRTLPETAIDRSAGGLASFAARYGFRSKPGRVRLRVLDPRHALLRTGSEEDITLDARLFAQLEPAIARIFVTENEINFLAFPALPDSWVIFGGGYGFDALAGAAWVRGKTVHYWGDLDTHGFAILDQLRSKLAHVESFLMDRETLLRHRSHWSAEPEPVLRDLPRLSAEERSMFDDLRWRRLGEDAQVRLEQERVGFGWIEQALARLWGGDVR